MRGMKISAEKCQYNGGVVPLGYKIVDKKYVIDDTTASLVVRIFDMYAGGKTIVSIINHLNEHQLGDGRIFTKNSLHNLLKNKKYIGTYTFSDVEIANGIPRIIDDGLFDEVQNVLAKNKHHPARARAKVEYLLTTKLFCGLCSSLMVGYSGYSANGKFYNYYSCNNSRKKLCTKKYVSKDVIEDFVIGECVKLLTPANIDKIATEVAALCESEKNTPNFRRLNKLLTENEKAVGNLMTAMERGENLDLISDRIAQRRKERVNIDKELALEKAQRVNLTAPQIKYYLGQLKKGDLKDTKYRKTLIHTFVNAVYVYDDRITIFFNSGDTLICIDKALLSKIEKQDRHYKCSYNNQVGVPTNIKEAVSK